MGTKDQRLIERGFPCHQVGAETQRERGASSALPPLYFLHVWWARRPLTPSRAAIVASLDSADTDPETFVRQLGIERVQAIVNEVPWTLTGELLRKVEKNNGEECLVVDDRVLRLLKAEQERRRQNHATIAELRSKSSDFLADPILKRWEIESQFFSEPLPALGEILQIERTMGDPAHVNERIDFAKSNRVVKELGQIIKWAPEDLYAYDRAYNNHPPNHFKGMTVLDPTSGGGSIPFEAMRLGCNVIANELNPVAATILYATLEYPARFGLSLVRDIEEWGSKLIQHVETVMENYVSFSPLPSEERSILREKLKNCPEILPAFDTAEYDHTGQLFVRQVTCPHCAGEAPLLNTCWLSKEVKDLWGVEVIPDGKPRGGKVKFETYRVVKGKGPRGQDPNFATVNRGVGQCIHCKQAISGD